MRMGFLVNDVETERPEYTTTRLAAAAVKLGHEVWLLGVGDFIYDADGSIHATARKAPGTSYDTQEDFLAELQGETGQTERITVDQLDVLMMRNDPAEDAVDRPWAQTSGVLFGQLAVRRGVMVLNDPAHLAHAINKTYFQHFPELVRPKTCISRNAEEIKQFVHQQQDKVVIKPLQGSGGQSVFVINYEDRSNINQMIDAVIRDGYCIAQQFLPAAAEGDVRLFVMNGQPLKHDGKYAAFRRVNTSGDLRSNMHSGGKSEPAEIGEQALQLVEMVRLKLVEDGMFLVGLDIVGDKLIEINVFSPGGLGSAQQHTGIDFAPIVIGDIERKIKHRQYYTQTVSNAQLATL
ncbi:MAG: glutathione synthetase [Pirellulales bacterium]